MSFLNEISDAFVNDDFDTFKKIIDNLKSIDITDEDWSDQTALVMISNQIGSDSGKFKFPLYLIEKGAKVNQTCGSMSPLLNAARNGAIDWMSVLIEKGADVNYFDNTYPPILEAIRGDMVESVKFLLSQPTIDLESAKEAAYGDTLMKFAKNKKAKNCIALFKEIKVK